MIKTCSKCRLEKDFSQFNKNKGNKDGLSYYCRYCVNENYKNNKQKASAYHRKNREKILKRQKEYRSENKENLKEYKRSYNKENKEKIANYAKSWRKKNKKHILEYKAKYYKDSYNNNPDFKVLQLLRNRMGQALKGNYKSTTTKKLIGCTTKELRRHLELQFTDGMSWDNYGKFGWHIDHIKPCASFDMSDPKQQKECFHYTNLQPLWAKDNLRKSDKIQHER